ncbi:unannotated protein [freshwater metagenome]|uniref:Unannotated protein n=1 Tax=freshwater metagenome TaxID=449393 RepID=A0A6J6SFN5_9ZZZZ
MTFFFRDVAYARASFVASSGETSTFARPSTPSRPNKLDAPRLSQMIEELTIAPASTILPG